MCEHIQGSCNICEIFKSFKQLK